MTMKKLLLILVITVATCFLNVQGLPWHSEARAEDIGQNDSVLAGAFRNRVSNVQVQGRGLVTSVLPDDNDGSRHQRFILRLDSHRVPHF